MTSVLPLLSRSVALPFRVLSLRRSVHPSFSRSAAPSFRPAACRAVATRRRIPPLRLYVRPSVVQSLRRSLACRAVASAEADPVVCSSVAPWLCPSVLQSHRFLTGQMLNVEMRPQSLCLSFNVLRFDQSPFMMRSNIFV